MKKRPKATLSKAARRARTKPAAARAEAAESASPFSLSLAGQCLVSGAIDLKAQLSPLLDVPLPVKLDISALQRIDTAAVQLIAAFVRAREAQGRQIEWHGNAPALAAAARLLGLTSALKLPA